MAIADHFKERFGVVTVLDAVLFEVTDVAEATPLIIFDTLKVSNINSEGQQKEIRGGQGADLLIAYDYGRTANIEITDALVSMESLTYLWGGKATSETGTLKNYKYGADGVSTPVSYTGAYKKLTLTSTDFPPTVRFVGTTTVINQQTGKPMVMRIVIPKFKLDANFTFTLEAEGDASVFDFSGVALSDNGNLMDIITYDPEKSTP